MPLVAQPLAEGKVVFDDAVVDDDDVAIAVAVRVGVEIAGAAVSRPARVADADGPFRKAPIEARREALQLSDRLYKRRDAAAVDDGDARAIVAAVLQPSQSLQQQRSRLARPNVSNDATQGFLPPLSTWNVAYSDIVLHRETERRQRVVVRCIGDTYTGLARCSQTSSHRQVFSVGGGAGGAAANRRDSDRSHVPP